jgi:nucleoside-diphosphate-sugar epimerase
VLLKKFLTGEARIEDGGDRVINQIHRHDAATALALLAREQPAGEIFNVADDTPLPQKETYRRMTEHFDRELPPAGTVDRNRKRGVTSKRVSNAKLRGLGWEPRYPSLTRGLVDDKRIIPSIRELIGES